MNNLNDVFRASQSQAGIPTIFANSWTGFLAYLFRRNRGYFQRKLLNLFAETVEISCMALVFNVHLLGSLLVFALTHVLINFITEFHWQLHRVLPAKWLGRRLNPLDYGLWILSGTFLGGAIWWAIERGSADATILRLLMIRLVSIVFQLAIAPWNVKFVTQRRVRPNLAILWSGPILASLISVPFASVIPGEVYVYFVALIFNLNKVVQEVSFTLRVRKEKYRQRLILPDASRLGIQPRNFMILGGLVFAHLATLALWSIRFRHEVSLTNALVVFFSVAFLDRLVGRPVRCLALDFDYARRNRLKILFTGILRRSFFFALIALVIGETLFLHYRGYTSHVRFGIIFLGLQGLMNQMWVYSASGVTMEKGHPAKWVLIFQAAAFLSLAFGAKAGGIPYYLTSTLSLLLSFRALFLEAKRPPQGSGHWMKFDWDPVIPNRRNFFESLRESGQEWTSLNRRSKAIRVTDQGEWLRLVQKFPLNIRNWRRLQALPERSAIVVPEEVSEVYPDFWGFWRNTKGGVQPGDEEAKHLHFTHRSVLEYPYYSGMFSFKKATTRQGRVIFAGPLDREGSGLWLR